ncbi:hypothetical protein KAS50_06470, partial [bacterium]|nr:hypothetical protein [bacterium]
LFLFPQGIVSVWKGILYSDISQQKAAALERNIPQISKGALILLTNVLVLFAGIFLYQTRKVSGTIAALLIIPMIIIDTYRIDREFVKTYPVEQVKGKSSPKYAAYEFLKEHDRSSYRVFPDHAYMQSQGNPFIRFNYEEISMITGFLDFTLWRYDNYMRHHLVSENSLSLLGTKYIVSLRDFPAGRFELVFNNNRERVYRNKKPLPFYYVRRNWVVEKDENTVLKLIDTNAVDLYNTAIIEKEPPKEFLNSEIKNDVTNIIFEEEDKFYTEWLSEFHFKIKGESPGLFVVSDNFHPGWRCYIDGKETEIYHANYLWKGVFFPAGEHEIHFKFISKNIVVSRMLMFSFMGLFFALFLFVCYKDYGLINRIKVLVKK